jgi:hypothetical protein
MAGFCATSIWYGLCQNGGVQIPRTLLIVLSVSACAMRVHAPSVDLPGAVREVNSCLRIVRLAASRRSRSSGARRRSTHTLSAGL